MGKDGLYVDLTSDSVIDAALTDYGNIDAALTFNGRLDLMIP